MQKYLCKTCGAEIFWNPDAGALKCEYCGDAFDVSQFEDHSTNKNATTPENLDTQYTNAGSNLNEDMIVYACTNCGAEVVTSKTTMATSCAYCGSAISITSKTAGKFRPELVIPYTINKNKAKEIYTNYVKKSFLTPKEFKDNNKVEKMQGLFVPFWLHSMSSHAQANFTCENVTHHRRGDDRVTTHKVYDVYVDASGKYVNVPTDGSKKLDNKLMDALEPFTYSKLTSYNPAYMAGFFSEQPDDEKESTIPRAQARVVQSMQAQMHQTAGNFSSKKMSRFGNQFYDSKANYAMLPVWLLNVSHKDKNYLFAINGDTGKAVGKIPMSIPKLLLCIAGVGVITQVMAFIVRFIMTMI